MNKLQIRALLASSLFVVTQFVTASLSQADDSQDSPAYSQSQGSADSGGTRTQPSLGVSSDFGGQVVSDMNAESDRGDTKNETQETNVNDGNNASATNGGTRTRLSLGVSSDFGSQVVAEMNADSDHNESKNETAQETDANDGNNAPATNTWHSTDVPVADPPVTASNTMASAIAPIGPPAVFRPVIPRYRYGISEQESTARQISVPPTYNFRTSSEDQTNGATKTSGASSDSAADRSPASYTGINEFSGAGGEGGEGSEGTSGASASAWHGSRSWQLNEAETNGQRWQSRNDGGYIGDRYYTDHALDQMQNRGGVPSVVEETIRNGNSEPGNEPGTTRSGHEENQTTVITNGAGDVITYYPGYSAPSDSTSTGSSEAPDASGATASESSAGGGDGE
jgi:hypothetical protein